MILGGFNNLSDFFRMIYFIPLLLIITNQPIVANGSQEFQVYRMQQYDMPHGNHYGSRINLLNMEARTISHMSSNSGSSGLSQVSRRCVLIKLNDFNIELYRQLTSQYVGAIIIILPLKYNDLQKSLIQSFELQMLKEDIKIPIYFVIESEEVLDYYDYIDKSSNSNQNQQKSAFRALIDSILTDGFQLVINSPQSQQIVQTNELQAVNLQAKLNGIFSSSINESSESSFVKKKIPTIIINAHYDSFGMATSLSYGCDSNGSGVVALLELSRVLAKLYSKNKTTPPLNIVFLLSAYGKLNYHGLKKWIEEQSETNEILGKIDLDEVAFAICLDSIGKSSINGASNLYMHVSKPPKEGQPSHAFMNYLERTANESNTNFELIHKKINLANELLAWEHERFSLNKIPAFTLSHFLSHKDQSRMTMTDTKDSIDKLELKKNINIIIRSIYRFMYQVDNIDELLHVDDLNVSDEFISSWIEQICSVPRSASLLNRNHPLINNFFQHFSHYLLESVKQPVKVQSKEPEFVLYNEDQSKLNISSIKPAIFDFFLSLIITAYISLIYLFVLNFNKFSIIVTHLFLINNNNSNNNNNPNTSNDHFNGKSKSS